MGKNILVCNLTRFGDLLQTQPAISDLAAAGHKVFLLCLENFAQAASVMRNLSGVFPLPAAGMMSGLSCHWMKGAAKMAAFVQEIREKANPDLIINLTPHLPARLLTKALARPETDILGFGLDASGFGENRGNWASFISVAARSRDYAPFNLAHMFRSLVLPVSGGFNHDFTLASPQKAQMDWADAFLKAHLPAGVMPSGHIAFQLGASEDRRRWPEKHFARLGDILWEQARICPILTGSANEKHLARAYGRFTNAPFIDASGATTLPELAALLSRSRLLVTNDTGTMHLAAGIGLQGLAFFLASAQPCDTGPYLPGWCCMEPARDCHPCSFKTVCQQDSPCGAIISPETAASLVLEKLSTGKWRDPSQKAANECRIWETAHADSGANYLIPLSGQENTERTRWMNLMRDFWSQLFDNMGAGQPFAIHSNSYPFNQEIAAELSNAANLLLVLEKQGELLKISPKKGQKFMQLCRELENMLLSKPETASLGAFWQEFQQNSGGDLQGFLEALKSMRAGLEWLRLQLLRVPPAKTD